MATTEAANDKSLAKKIVRVGLAALTEHQLKRLKYHLEHKTPITVDCYAEFQDGEFRGCPATLANSLNPQKAFKRHGITTAVYKTFRKMCRAVEKAKLTEFGVSLMKLTSAEARQCIRQVLRAKAIS
jgi:hypothetical protein